VWSALEEATRMADELDLAWCYVCMRPMFAVRRKYLLTEAPSGWTGNTRAIESAIQREKDLPFVAAMQVATRPGSYELTSLPLASLLKIRDAYLRADSITQELIDLHIQVYKAERGDLFFLAKALELAGRFFGDTRLARNSGLQNAMVKAGVTAHLTCNVEQLFDLANERYDVRHVVDPDTKGVVLHPRMTWSESEKFRTNADLVVRTVICSRLGVDMHLLTFK